MAKKIKETKGDKEFYEEIDKIFELNLDYFEKDILYVKDLKKNEVLKKLPYHKVFFDNNLNFYKVGDNGSIAKVENKDFSVVIEKKKVFYEKQNLPF